MLPDATGPDPATCLGAAGLGLWEVDSATTSVHFDPACLALHGFDPGYLPSVADWLDRLHPTDGAALAAALAGGLPPGADCRIETRLRTTQDAAPRWIEIRGRRDPQGHRLCGVALDITARRAVEDRTALVMREVDHRAKNTLSTVQALLRLTRADTPAAYARALEGRIATLGRVQALLARPDAPASLDTLLRAELAPYAGAAARMTLAGSTIVLDAETVQPLSMAVHELATNAAKHGALSVPEGRVTVTWAAAAGGVCIAWTELGGPALAGAPARAGFGSVLLRNLVMGQLGGTLTLDWDTAGLRCAINLPARVLAP